MNGAAKLKTCSNVMVNSRCVSRCVLEVTNADVKCLV